MSDKNNAEETGRLLGDEAPDGQEIPADLSIRVNADLFRIAFMCASREETRYFLNGVHIEPHPDGGALLTATDGHRLVSIYDQDGEASESATVSVTKEFLRLCKSGAEIPRQLHVFGPDGTVKEGGTPIGFAANCILPGAFPDWRKVVPAFDGDAGPFPAFHGPLVEGFSKIGVQLAKVKSVSSAAMRIVTRGNEDAALVLWPNMRHAFGILMPMQSDDATTLPQVFVDAGVVGVAAAAGAKPNT